MLLTGKQVLKRMKAGDCPTLRGGYTESSVFADGAIASHKVMVKLRKESKINFPEHTSIYSQWTLNKDN